MQKRHRERPERRPSEQKIDTNMKFHGRNEENAVEVGLDGQHGIDIGVQKERVTLWAYEVSQLVLNTLDSSVAQTACGCVK